MGMHDQFPAFKLVTLIARQMSAPIATRIKTYAKTHPVFSRVVCGGAAELYQLCEWRARMLAVRAAGPAGRGSWRARHPPPLSPNEARDMGGDLLGELIIFMLGSVIVIFEVNRQAMIKEKAEENERAQWAALRAMLETTRLEVRAQQERIDRLRAILRHLLAQHQPPER